MKCQSCAKIGVSGNTISHSNRHTKTRFMPNVHKVTLSANGERFRVKICTRCLRSWHKLPRK